MGKMPLGKAEPGSGRRVLVQEGGAKLEKLVIREGVEEAFEKDDGLAKAGIEVVMGGIEEVPFALGKIARGVVQFGDGGSESLVEIFDKFEQRGDFVKKLRALSEEDAAADTIQAGGAATLGMLKIIGIERTEIRRDAKVFCVGVHGAKYRR